jgi:uncharacterized protein (DUF488 family)
VSNPTTLYTIGHSNQPQAALLEALMAHGIEVLADVRRYPRSRRNPQFNDVTLAAALADDGVEYRHFETLGGRRDADPESRNTGLPAAFRGFADYMTTPEFDAALRELISLARAHRVAIMCAEGDPSNCHRSLISDALVTWGVAVEHIVKGGLRRHELSPRALLDEGRVTYPSLL